MIVLRNPLTRDQFEDAVRRYANEGGHSIDEFTLLGMWIMYQEQPEKFGYLWEKQLDD